jgi:3-methyladenine DNA glycosylase AlkD
VVTAVAVIEQLRRLSDAAELAKVRKRLAPDEQAFGLRMKALFDTAKAHTALPLKEVARLLDHPAYEPRMAAFCILDFKARRRTSEQERQTLHDLYLDRHDAITTWDMVDRAAPRVIGGHLLGRDKAVLHALAASQDPLRRRTALTAPLMFVRSGTDDEVAESLRIAATTAADPDPVVHKPVCILLKYVSERDQAGVVAFLDEHAASMPRAAVRLAVEKLPPSLRDGYLAASSS